MAVVDIEKLLKGDAREVSKAVSLVENGAYSTVRSLLLKLHPLADEGFVIGVTGSPGSGKSTLVDQLARRLVSRGEKVGVLAIDPTSPFTGGAILGDRVRMQALATNPGVFIRSMATRGRLGGLSAAAADALVVLGAGGFRTRLVETVGVGQDEVDIVTAADVTVVVLVPGMGDGIQAIKAGIMEIGDLFVINKADREGSAQLRRDVESLLTLSEEVPFWRPAVIETVATRGEGIEELVSALDDFRERRLGSPDWIRRKALFHKRRILDLLRDREFERALKRLGEDELTQLVWQVARKEMDPYTAVERLIESD